MEFPEKPAFASRILNAIPGPLRGYVFSLVPIAVLVGVASAALHIFGRGVPVLYVVLALAYLLVLLAAAWAGYGPGLVALSVTTFVVPHILTLRQRPGPPDWTRFGLYVLVSLLISRIADTRRKRERELRQLAGDLEVRVRQRTEEALRSATETRVAEERLHFVLDSAEIGYWDYDVHGKSMANSNRLDRIFGPVERWDYDTVLRYIHPDDREQVIDAFRETLTGETCSVEFRIARAGEKDLWVWTQGRAHRDGNGEIAHLSGVIIDVTRRKESEDNIREQAQLLNLAHDAILSLDMDGSIRFWNNAAERMYGWTAAEAIGQVSHNLLRTEFPEPLSEIEKKVFTRGHWEGELVHHRKDGSAVTVSSRWAARHSGEAASGTLEINTDITEKRRIEEQLRHTQKLESLGVLAGGVAHDFNNLLTGILGNSSLALDNVAEHHPNRLLIEEVMKAAERAADLTRQLLAYAGKGRFVMRTVDLSDLVREISGLVQTSIPKPVQLRLQLGEPLPGIDADPGQLQQIVMNLVINGAEAIGPEGGSVLVRTGTQQVDDHYIHTMSSAGDLLHKGPYVCLEVHDTGTGMDEETLARIFDPFFSTKFAGRGLGLSAVLGIVRSHKGALKVYSKPGQGTTFKVLFPASTNRVSDQPPALTGDLAGTGTVLVVDDEELVRRTAQNTLEKYGYRIVTAEDGAQAIDTYRRAADGISLVLLDLTMPVVSGEQALRELQMINPKVRVLLTSGYNEVEAVQRFSGKGLAGFIQKPYTAAALAEKVKEVLAS